MRALTLGDMHFRKALKSINWFQDQKGDRILMDQRVAVSMHLCSPCGLSIPLFAGQRKCNMKVVLLMTAETPGCREKFALSRPKHHINSSTISIQ